MFMINSSTALAAILAVILVLVVVVDKESRLRIDRVDGSQPLIWQVRDQIAKGAVDGVKSGFRFVFRRRGADDKKPDQLDGERAPLLG